MTAHRLLSISAVAAPGGPWIAVCRCGHVTVAFTRRMDALNALDDHLAGARRAARAVEPRDRGGVVTDHRLVSIDVAGIDAWAAVCACGYATERDRRVAALAALDEHIAEHITETRDDLDTLFVIAGQLGKRATRVLAPHERSESVALEVAGEAERLATDLVDVAAHLRAAVTQAAARGRS